MLESPLYAIKNHEMQYCAKVMRANFDEIRALFSQFFVELSPDISNELRRLRLHDVSIISLTSLILVFITLQPLEGFLKD